MNNSQNDKCANRIALQFYEKLEQVKDNSLNIILEGENGVGKEYFARQIHEKRDWSHEFIIFDWECDHSWQQRILDDLSENHLSTLLDKDNMRRNTYFFRRIDLLNPQMQLEIIELLENEAIRKGLSRSQIHQLGLVATLEKNVETQEKEKILPIIHLQEFFPLTIRIPALRKRKNEIIYLMYAMLDNVNNQLNRAVEGFSPETYDFFLAYNWPNNIDELRSEIEREVALTRDNHLINTSVLSERLIKLQPLVNVDNFTGR